MKWGRKNSTSSSSGLSSIFQVFPIAWFIKFKEMSSKSKSQPVKSKQKTKPNSSLSSTIPVSFRNTQIYNGDIPGDDDAYWQFSLRREDFEGMKNRGGVRSIWYDSDDECEFRMSSFQSCRSSARKLEAKEETKNFSEMLSDIRNNRNLGGGNREEIVLKTQQKITRMAHKVTNQKLRKTERILQEVGSDSSRESIKLSQASNPESIEKKNMDLEPMAVIGSTKREYSSSDYGLRKYYYNTASNSKNINWKRTINDGDQEFMALNSKKSDQSLEEEEEIAVDSKRKTEREPKVKDFLSKREQQRKSIYICKEVHKRRAKQSCKVCFCSPRTASKTKICKIRALEDMKKDKTKKERTVGVPSLERFAMVKFSFDPQKDFRDSMVEMIVENSIRRSEELENLLACYLSLNSDEYHDLINEVFWQVWCDLNK